MIRPLIRTALCVLLLLTWACSSTSTGTEAGMTYREAVRKIGRQPTSMSRAPGGEMTATWETEAQGGTRHLIMNFGSDGRLKSSKTKTVPTTGAGR